jgi:hypothetical protein
MPEGDVVEGLHLSSIGDAGLPGGGPGDTDGRASPSTGESREIAKGTKDGSQKKSVEAPNNFILSEGLPPVPAKLVGRILKGEFIDMAELLRDNLEAQRRGCLQQDLSAPAASSSGQSRPRREVPDLLSWVQCFGVYIAIMASKYPERIQKLLAYQALIIREARRCGAKGWLSYDSYFRQQMAGEWRGDEWGRLNPYLFSSTFLALGSSQRPNCTLCLEPDHHDDECALAKPKLSYAQPKLREHRRESSPDLDTASLETPVCGVEATTRL